MKTQKITIAILFIVLLGVIGCNNSEFSENGTSIEESNEMEEYIKSGIEFMNSYEQFQKELSEIDISKIIPTIDSKGNLVMHIPTSICMEEITGQFNKTKKALLDKYPSVRTIKPVNRQDIIKKCIDRINSTSYDESFIITRSTITHINLDSAETYLDEQIASSDYVEVALYVFENNVVKTDIHSSATSTSTIMNVGKKPSEPDAWYWFDYPVSPIDFCAHTHRYSSAASSDDLEFKESHPGLDFRIYYSGSFHNVN